MRVMTNGCFDIFHLGHLEMLNFASSLGEELFVAINSDLSIKKLKGNQRPILGEEYRLSFLNALPFVTKAQIFDDKRCTKLIYEWNPDIYIKSNDYNLENLDESEKKALEIARGKHDYHMRSVSKADALSYYKEQGNEYKVELIENLETILKLLFFKIPDFFNLFIIYYCIATTSFTSGK